MTASARRASRQASSNNLGDLGGGGKESDSYPGGIREPAVKLRGRRCDPANLRCRRRRSSSWQVIPRPALRLLSERCLLVRCVYPRRVTQLTLALGAEGRRGTNKAARKAGVPTSDMIQFQRPPRSCERVHQSCRASSSCAWSSQPRNQILTGRAIDTIIDVCGFDLPGARGPLRLPVPRGF